MPTKKHAKLFVAPSGNVAIQEHRAGKIFVLNKFHMKKVSAFQFAQTWNFIQREIQTWNFIQYYNIKIMKKDLAFINFYEVA